MILLDLTGAWSNSTYDQGHFHNRTPCLPRGDANARRQA